MFNKYILISGLFALIGGIIFIAFFKQRSLLKKSALYKIVSEQGFNKTNIQDCIKISSLDKKSGFIHTSYGNQVKKTINKFFIKENKVLAIELDKEELKKHGITINPEANKPGGEVYPHLYGSQTIPYKAVKKIIVFEKNASNLFKEVR